MTAEQSPASVPVLRKPLSPADHIYLAARYTKRELLCGYRDEIHAMGATVTSRWLNGDHQLSDAGQPVYEDGTPMFENPDGDLAAGSAQAADHARRRFAIEDADDVVSAHVLIAFTEEPRQTRSRGGRHVELGMAIGLLAAREMVEDTSTHYFGPRMRRVIVIGPRENVFTWLPEVEWAPTWEAARPLLLPALTGPSPQEETE